MSQPRTAESPATTDASLEHVAALLIGRAAALVPHSKADVDRLEAVLDAMPGFALPEVAALTEQTVSPAMWSIYLQVFAHKWNEEGVKTSVRRLVVLSSIHDDAADQAWYPLVTAAVSAIAVLGDPGNQVLPRLQTLHELAVETDRVGEADLAYDIAAIALELGPPPGVEREVVALYALNLGLKARRAHQVAICAVEVACCRIALVGADATSRLAAFDASETAMEHIWQAKEPFRGSAARRLYRAVIGEPWLRLVCAPLLMLSEHAEELAQALGSAEWPTRVQTLTYDDWARQLAVIFDILRVEQDIEAKRIELEPDFGDRRPNVDWVTWTLAHPAYRRAVPHHQSFLRERDFDQNLLVLMHEMTHALSLLGGIGTVLTALRVVALHNELVMWSSMASTASEVVAQIEEDVVAPLPAGHASHLFRAERGVELTLKSHALQDAWTPWFEGLAVFAEGAADPVADPNSISPIADALRNLIDFHPTPGANGVFDDKAAIIAQFEKMSAEFEDRVSKAIAHLGWERLHSGAARLRQRHYFAGYLAVRVVVAAWRRTLARPLGGPEALRLLLHATRFGTFDAVPDLSLPADAFATSARDAMARWAAKLAGLGAAELEDFLKPPESNGAGSFYVWRDGHLYSIRADDPEVPALELRMRERLAREAQASLSGDIDAGRLGRRDPSTMAVERAIATHFRKWLTGPEGEDQVARNADQIAHLLTRGSLFPIGRSAAGFYLNVPPDVDNARLTSRIRTTEAHINSGQPSVNSVSFSISSDSASRLAELYGIHAMPRLTVTRLIDLGGSIFPGGPPNMHVLAWHHADWLHLQGPTQAIDKMLRRDAQRLGWAHDAVRHRLTPNKTEQAEMAIAEGSRGARRTRDWIDETENWEIPELGVAVPDWAALVRAKAVRVLDEAVRPVAWRGASETLLRALWGKLSLAKAVANMDYNDLVAGFPPDEVTRALFRCAMRPTPDPWLNTNADRLAEAGLAIFENTPFGWDVRAATIGEG